MNGWECSQSEQPEPGSEGGLCEQLIYSTLVFNIGGKIYGVKPAHYLVTCPSIGISANTVTDSPAAKEPNSGRWPSENGSRT